MRVNDLLKVIMGRKITHLDLNLRHTDPEIDTLTTKPPRLTIGGVAHSGAGFSQF